MVAKVKEFFRISIGLSKMALSGILYVAVFAGLLFASFLILAKGTDDYGLLAGILISIPFIAVLWFGALGIGAWLSTAK